MARTKGGVEALDSGGDPRADIRLGRLGDFVGFRLSRVHHRLSVSFSQLTVGMGLRQGMFSSMAIIAANPGISQSDLSHEVGLDKSVMVTIIDDLERFGWAERRRSTKDRRRHALYVTPAGEARLQELFDRMQQVEADVLHQLSQAELAMLSTCLDRMYEVTSKGHR